MNCESDLMHPEIQPQKCAFCRVALQQLCRTPNVFATFIAREKVPCFSPDTAFATSRQNHRQEFEASHKYLCLSFPPPSLISSMVFISCCFFSLSRFSLSTLFLLSLPLFLRILGKFPSPSPFYLFLPRFLYPGTSHLGNSGAEKNDHERYDLVELFIEVHITPLTTLIAKTLGKRSFLFSKRIASIFFCVSRPWSDLLVRRMYMYEFYR